MTWYDINANEVTVDAEITQGLLNKIREDLYDLKDYKAGGLYIFGTMAYNTNTLLDNNRDWRDRYLTVTGAVYWEDTLADAQALIPGGSQDKYISSATGGPAFEDSLYLGCISGSDLSLFMYSEQGSSAYNVAPYMREYSVISSAAFYVWVDSTTGYLYTRAALAGAGDYIAYNLQILFSEDQGAY